MGIFGFFVFMFFLVGPGVGEDVLEDLSDVAEDKQVAQKVKGKTRAVGRRTKKSRED